MPATGSVRLLPRLLESPGVHLTDLAHDLFAARQHGVQLRYKHRAYPNASQRRALAQAFGCARVVWNDCRRGASTTPVRAASWMVRGAGPP
ncbi:helix-turn-helix domain-containing protein [Streptomyces fungicidicus]|uniref:helix-turn-helix domain-containing protein n=1 Tax=Streptomyces fungicidicus TaxID=68203 RepID=UPI003664FD4F